MTTQRPTRKAGERKPWQRQQHLRTPPPPPGYAFRWIRYCLDHGGTQDVQNVMRREAEGYEIVRIEKLRELGGPEFDGLYQTNKDGAVVNGDLMLTLVHEETRRERNDYYQSLADRQAEAVRQELRRSSHPSMPISDDSRSSVTVGGRGKAFED